MAKIKTSRKVDKSSKSKDHQGDTVGWIVQEQLISDLASGRVGGVSFPLSPTQETLKIDRSIVYLSTLCFTEQDDMVPVPSHSNKDIVPNSDTIFSSRLKDRFATLQRIYHDALARKETCGGSQSIKPGVLFELSLILCPSKDQLEVVVRDLKAVKINLTTQAQQAAEDLLKEVGTENSFQTGKREHQQDKPCPPKSKPVTHLEEKCVSNPMVEQRQPKQDKQTLEELLRQRYISENSANSSNDDSIDASWIEVSKIKRKDSASISPTLSSTVQRLESTVVYESPTPILPTACYKQSRSSREPEIRDGAGTKVPGALKLYDDEDFDQTTALMSKDHCAFGVKEGPQTPSCPSSDIFSTSCDRKNERIRDLEASIDEMKREHAKTLQMERQRYDDLIQSLQLRLYISETRLKTYEEALRTHIQAVAANVCSGGLPPSPDRMSFASVTRDEVMSSPRSLISKALQKNNVHNEKSIDSTSGDGMGSSCAFST
jgi:hypothetical protein